MNDFTDHLESWWNNASVAYPREGDTIIFREAREDGSHYYGIETAEEDFAGGDNIRILHRAPAPKPAWHNAIAVIATLDQTANGLRAEDAVWARDPNDGIWTEAFNGLCADSSELSAVTPLIEARVTDEMVDRAYRWFSSGHYGFRDQLREVLHAALGLDAE